MAHTGKTRSFYGVSVPADPLKDGRLTRTFLEHVCDALEDLNARAPAPGANVTTYINVVIHSFLPGVAGATGADGASGTIISVQPEMVLYGSTTNPGAIEQDPPFFYERLIDRMTVPRLHLYPLERDIAPPDGGVARPLYPPLQFDENVIDTSALTLVAAKAAVEFGGEYFWGTDYLGVRRPFAWGASGMPAIGPFTANQLLYGDDAGSGGIDQSAGLTYDDTLKLLTLTSNTTTGTFLNVTDTSVATQSVAAVTVTAGVVAVSLLSDGLGTGTLGTAGAVLGVATNHPLGVLTNNLERVRVTAAGMVGINRTSPNAYLHVHGAAPTAYLSQGSDTGIADLRVLNELVDSTRAVSLSYSGTAYATSILTGGITGEAGALTTTGAYPLMLGVGGAVYLTMTTTLRGGVGNVTDPTARLHLPAGTAAVKTAPLKLTAGTNMTAPEAGAIEFDGTSLYYTDSTPTRRTLLYAGAGAGISGTITTTQIAYGDVAANTIKGISTFTFDGTNMLVGTVTAATDAIVTVRADRNSGTSYYVVNATNGTASAAYFAAGNGSKALVNQYVSAANTTVSGIADAGWIRTDSGVSGGLVLGAGGANTIRMTTNDVVRATMSSAGNMGFLLNLGSGTLTPDYRMHAVGTGATLAGNGKMIMAVSQDQTTYRGVGLGYDSTGQIGLIVANTASAASILAFWTYSGSAFAERWRMNGSGHFLAGTDNTYDIGATGATRPRTAYLGTSLIIGTTLTLTASLLNASGALSINTTDNQAITTGSGLFTSGGHILLSSGKELQDSSGNSLIALSGGVSIGDTTNAVNINLIVDASSQATVYSSGGIGFPSRGSDPGGHEGEVFYRSDTKTLKAYLNGGWVTIQTA